MNWKNGAFLVCLLAVSIALCGFEVNKGYDPGARANLTAQNTANMDPTGFESPEDISCAYATSARTITLAQTGGVILWWRGTRINLGTPWTSTAHATGDGTFYLACRTSAVPEWSTDAWTFDMAQFAVVYIHDGITIATKETHGLMPWYAHEENHKLLGAYRGSGCTADPTTYELSPSSPSNASNTPGFIAGEIDDEDNHTAISAWPEDVYSKLYFTGRGVVTINTAATYPLRLGTTYPMVNGVSAGTFSETETTQNRWLNVYQILMPATADAENQVYRTLLLQPQVAHASLAAAQAEDFRSLNLGGLSLISSEFVAFTRITYRTSASYSSAGKVRIEDVSYLSGSKASQVALSGFAAPSLSSLNVPNHDLVTVDASGVIPLANGGTGATTAASASIALSAGMAVVVAHDIIATDSSGTPFYVSFATEIYDTTNSFSGGTFTAPSSGTYLINAALRWDYDGDGTDREFWLRKNGSELTSADGYEGSFVQFAPSRTAYLEYMTINRCLILKAGDTIQCVADMDGTGNDLNYHSYINIIQLNRMD